MPMSDPLNDKTPTAAEGERLDLMACSANLHEDLAREDDIVGSSDRAFGLTLAAVFAVIGVVRLALGHSYAGWWLCAAAVMLAFALAWPAALAPLNRLWLRLGLVLYKVVNPLVMGLVFFTTVMPIGLLMRALGKDPLRLRRDPAAGSYWITREPPGPEPDTMKNQF
jgi:saxitoxin biosynthesis operon SxtJ-like protein